MYRVEPEAMPGNPAAGRLGDKSGLWQVVVYDQGTGSIIQKKPSRVMERNLTYDEAFRRAGELENKLNAE